MSVIDQPSGVRIVTDLPLAGTVPANVTTPPAGAWTTSAAPPPISMPRCCPAAYGCAGSNTNGSRIWPLTGQVQARAGAAAAKKTNSATASRRIGTRQIKARRMGDHLRNRFGYCCLTSERCRSGERLGRVTIGGRVSVVKKDYSSVTKSLGRGRFETRRSTSRRHRPRPCAAPPRPRARRQPRRRSQDRSRNAAYPHRRRP